MSVDFPAPFSPSSAWTSPGSTSRFTPRSACTPPNRLVTPATRIKGVAISGEKAATDGSLMSHVSFVRTMPAFFVHCEKTHALLSRYHRRDDGSITFNGYILGLSGS